MNSFLEDLKKYFENNSRDKVIEDWEKSKEFDQIGISMDDFMYHTQIYYKVQTEDPLMGCNLTYNDYSPKFSSGFLFYKTNNLCNKLLFQ